MLTFQYFISFILVVVYRMKSPLLAEGILSISREPMKIRWDPYRCRKLSSWRSLMLKLGKSLSSSLTQFSVICRALLTF